MNRKMNLQMQVKKIEVFYDGRCGMCCSFHEWIHRQERAFQIDFVPYQAERAEEVFPGIHTLDPAREMIVRADNGEIYRGAEAWVMCLYSCANHRDMAKRLARPAMLAVAIRVCHLLAANRHGLSKVFFRRKDKEVRKTLHQMDLLECPDDTCVITP